MSFPIEPPIEPMLAKARRRRCPPAAASSTSPSGTASARSCSAAAARSSSRAAICGRSIATSPSCTTFCVARLPDGCVVDGEIVIATPHGLDFDALQMRLHPAASRVAKLAKETPASFVAFDLLAVGRPGHLRGEPQASGARGSRALLAGVEPPLHLTPVTRDRARRRRVAAAIRRRRSRRRDRQAGRSARTSPASAR